MDKVSTGLLIPGTTKDSVSGSKSGRFGAKGGSYGLQTMRSFTTRHAGTQRRETVMRLGDQMTGQHTTTVRGDTKSDRSFGSDAIMVRRSVEIDEISVPEL